MACRQNLGAVDLVLQAPQPPAAEQTQYDGVVATITRFEQDGALLTVEITVQNTSDKRMQVCTRASSARLIDQATGESWEALHGGGELSQCGRVNAHQSTGVWMQFTDPVIKILSERSFALYSDA